MVKGRGGPARGRVMAGRALGSGHNVSGRLGLSVLCNVGAAVAGRTLGQTGVVHRRRCPAHKAIDVTGVALGSHWNVSCRFGQGVD